MLVRAFTKYGRSAASTRQRVLQYVPALKAAGIRVAYEPLLDDDYVRNLEIGVGYSKAAILRSYARRLHQVASERSADAIWVYAELFPYLPGAFERLIFRSGIPVIYDFDDAFFHAYDEHPKRAVRAALGGKLEPLLRGAAACCCGNEYLFAYARRFCASSIVLPTVVDTDDYMPAPARPDRPPVIGWIGSPSTWSYLRPLLPVLAALGQAGVTIRVIGAGEQARAEAGHLPGFDFVWWAEDKEVADVQSMDIGIMPVPDEPWARGKSGYKLIQYMACGVPAVASPVGVNRDIVVPDETGFLASTTEQWAEALQRLVTDPALRARMGSVGRVRCERTYSLGSQAPRLIEVFRSVAARPSGPG